MTTPASPAQRYAASRRRTQAEGPRIAAFQRLYDFEFDEFQLAACRAVDRGHGVLLAAPTGSGKTVAGEFAVHLALAEGRKCFYTTPIKALSNQKYADLVRRYSPASVGLLTGDNSINGEAPIVVMTTEVLRNMLYASSPTLGGLGYVVLDEVHYLADRFRGAVWEEVIIQLPEPVRVVALSATVSNAEEFGDWLGQVRGGTEVIVDEHRPVPLWQHVLVGRRMYDLFSAPPRSAADDARPMVNPELLRAARQEQWGRGSNGGASGSGRRGAGYHGSGYRGSGYRGSGNRGSGYRGAAAARRGGGPGRPQPDRFRPPSRPEVIERLDAAGLLPAITFIFSRAGCDTAVAQCLGRGLRLTTPEEAAEITELATERTAGIPETDRGVLGYAQWLTGLQHGIAAHHAGLLPAFKEVVEELFAAGLVRAVFATETLALGINMPARSVVIEQLDKWNGENHTDLTPGEYTQLTGRAGRRGIDVEGHAVVIWRPGMDPAALAGLAGTRTYPLNSSFRPSYNMAVNLVRQAGRQRAAALLESSFAQFQADRSVVGLARQARRLRQEIAGLADGCDRGDIAEYAALRLELSQREGDQARQRSADRRAAAVVALEQLRRGDIIRVPAGRRAGLAVVLEPGRDGDVAPLVLTEGRQVKRLSAADFPVPVSPIQQMRVPNSFSARSAGHRRDLAASMRSKLAGVDLRRSRHDGRAPGGDDAEIPALRRRLRQHPCHDCPDREQHLRQAEKRARLEREAAALERRVAGRSHVLARTFDRVCALLGELGYIHGDAVTADGQRLASLYGELDLLAAECLRRRTWAGLTPAELAACVSLLTFESRRPDDAGPARLPPGKVREVAAEMIGIWADLDSAEKEHRLDFLREPDPGFARTAHAWAQGDPLDRLLSPDLTAGDFVRAVKQIVDLLDQVAAAAGREPLAAKARAAIDLLRRGVVAYSSVG